MKRRTNTMDPLEFLISSIFWALVPYISYRNALFRALPDLSFKASLGVLWILLVLSVGGGMVLAWNQHRNHLRIFVHTVFAYGLYTVLAYYNNLPGVMYTLAAVACVCSVGFAIVRLSPKIRRPQHRGRIITERLRQTLWGARVITAGCLSVMVAVMLGRALFGYSLVPKSIKPVVAQQDSVYTIEQQMETLSKLEESTWATLSTKERVNVLQLVANIENQHLGLPTELNVVLSSEGENLIASYRDNLHTICFNVDYLDTQSAEKSIDSICHEAQHAYLSRLVDAMHEVGEKNRDLQVFQRAALYEQEFNHYKTASKSFSGYYNQACETDARTYGKIRTQTYMNAIEAYCRGTDTP